MRFRFFVYKMTNGAWFEQPMKFEVVIHLKAAKQIGLTIPQWTLMKATKVIQ